MQIIDKNPALILSSVIRFGMCFCIKISAQFIAKVTIQANIIDFLELYINRKPNIRRSTYHFV
tara:strand:+ start:932 stop:1120 length:189 start_codon:yes stop_codon:yes gene_type:complete